MRRDATSALIRAIEMKLPPSVTFRAEEVSSHAWASATFTGARHELAFRLDGPDADAAADAFLADLDEAEFVLRGHILADINLVSRAGVAPGAVRIAIEALTVEAD